MKKITPLNSHQADFSYLEVLRAEKPVRGY